MHNIKMQNINNFFAQSHACLFRRVVLSLMNTPSSISKSIRYDSKILIFIIIYYLEEKQRKKSGPNVRQSICLYKNDHIF